MEPYQVLRENELTVDDVLGMLQEARRRQHKRRDRGTRRKGVGKIFCPLIVFMEKLSMIVNLTSQPIVLTMKI